MADATSSADRLHALFVDEDGRLGGIVAALQAHPDPVETTRAETPSDAVAVADEQRVDCIVLLDAPATEELSAVDWIGAVEYLRAELPDVPLALHSVLGEHETVRQAHERDVTIISASGDEVELVYRQLRAAAGMERHAKSSGAILESLMGHYPHQLYIKDAVGRFESMSVGTATQYDMKRKQMVNLSDFDVLDDWGERTHAEEQRLLRENDSFVDRIDHWVDETDRDRWVAVTKAPRYDDDGNPLGIVGSSREVTKEKRKEQMVRELHTVGRELVRAESKAEIGRAVMAMASDIPLFSHIQVVLGDSGMLDPLSMSGDDADEQTANEANETDSDAEQVSNDTERASDGTRQATDESLFDRYEERFRTVIDDGEPQYVTAGGQSIDDPGWAEDLTAAVLPLGSHGALGLAADAGSFTDFGIDLANILASNLEAALDRTERERDLERQNEHLEEFASIVSHDLRNPLNVASAATELLAEDVDSPQIDRIESALTRMEELIEALLTLARKGQVVGETEFVTVETAARTAWEVIDAPEATLTVVSSGVVTADRNRLVELFENLFRNAVEHGSTNPPSQAQEDAAEHGSTGREGGVSVTVGIRDAGDGFYVADDGSGIDPAVRDELFEMGVSGADGTGYGLYIVSTIAEAHGWTVRAGESDSGGARFNVIGPSLVENLDS